MIRDTRTQTFTGYTEEKIVEYFADGYVEFFNEIFFWSSNDRVPFEDIITDFFEAGLISGEVLINSNAHRKVQVSSFLDDYVIAQANRSPEQIAEEQMMARNAFGDQQNAVNIITGEIIF